MRINGRKRQIVTDTIGLLVGALFMVPTFKIATARRIC